MKSYGVPKASEVKKKESEQTDEANVSNTNCLFSLGSRLEPYMKRLLLPPLCVLPTIYSKPLVQCSPEEKPRAAKINRHVKCVHKKNFRVKREPSCIDNRFVLQSTAKIIAVSHTFSSAVTEMQHSSNTTKAQRLSSRSRRRSIVIVMFGSHIFAVGIVQHRSVSIAVNNRQRRCVFAIGGLPMG